MFPLALRPRGTKVLAMIRDKKDAAARIAASNMLLDRGWGKPGMMVFAARR